MTSLFSQTTACWLLIEVAKNILSPRNRLAVAPINDNEIAILGGYGGTKFLSDVVVFSTKTKICQKVTDGGFYKFLASGNQCTQTGKNKVLALVMDRDGKPAVISWAKGDSAVTILDSLIK